jgi:hypothetical protein
VSACTRGTARMTGLNHCFPKLLHTVVMMTVRILGTICLADSSSPGCITDPPTGSETLITGYNETSCRGRPNYEIGTSCTAICQAGSTGGFTTCLHSITDLTSPYWATHPCKLGEVFERFCHNLDWLPLLRNQHYGTLLAKQPAVTNLRYVIKHW